MARGYLSLVLHAHLPYVRHPEYESFLEETWLFEAITDTYIPLLRVFDRLVGDGIPFRLTLSISPPLMAMLQDRLPADALPRPSRQDGAPGRQGDPAQPRQSAQPRGGADVSPAAPRNPRVLPGLRRRSAGRLPAPAGSGRPGDRDGGGDPRLSTDPQDRAVGGAAPRSRLPPSAIAASSAGRCRDSGFPECGYYPGLERMLAARRGALFFVETHGIANASAPPAHGYLAPLDCGNGVAAFGRDPPPRSWYGAPAKAIPAIRGIATSIATSASTSISTTSGRTSSTATPASSPASSTTG